MQKKTLEMVDLDGIDELLRQKMIEEADCYEQEINNDPSLAGIEPDPEMLNKILTAIEKEEAKETVQEEKEEVSSMAHAPEDFLSEEDRRALELGRRQLVHPVRRRIMNAVGIAAAIMVGIFGASISIEANREKLMDVVNMLVANESVTRVDNEAGHQLYEDDEEKARAEIEAKLGIRPLIFMYMPDGMVFDDYVVDEITENAMLFYRYKDTILYVKLENRENSSTQGGTRDGEIIDTLEVETEFGTVFISEIQGPEEKDYLAEITYDGCYYSIYGILPKEEFVNMIEKILI